MRQWCANSFELVIVIMLTLIGVMLHFTYFHLYIYYTFHFLSFALNIIIIIRRFMRFDPTIPNGKMNKSVFIVKIDFLLPSIIFRIPYTLFALGVISMAMKSLRN